MDGKKIKKRGIVTPKIDTGDHWPMFQLLHPHPPGHLQIIEELTQQMLENDLLELSWSVLNFNLVLVWKKTGETKFCIDFWKINECIWKDAYTSSRINACLDALSGAELYCTYIAPHSIWDQDIIKYHWTLMMLIRRPSSFEIWRNDSIHGTSIWTL